VNELALFAGAGGGILAGKLLGWRTVCAVEWEPYAACVLAARQNDGLLPPFPVWDDVQTFDGRPWAGIVDVVSGGFPCQDISVAGKGAGITGERSGMWRHMARIVGEVRPRYVFVENSPALITRGLGVVLGDLAALGYDCKWTVLGAADVGAPHQRDRFWLVAHASGERHQLAQQALCAGRDAVEPCGEMADTDDSGQRADSWRWEGGKSFQARDDFGGGGATMAHTKLWIGALGRDDAGMGRIKELGSRRDAGTRIWGIEPDVGRTSYGLAQGLDCSGADE
jgi:DNA (cytosine-5)-methyltransferase 1